MPAITDKFTHANNGTIAEPAQLSANKTTLDTTASLTLATGWPTDTAIHIEMFKVGTDGSVTPGTITHWKATLSGTTLSNMTLEGGVNQSYATGDPVILMPTPYWANDVVDGILVQHKQDGTHADTITTNTINENTPANGVTIDGLNIKDSAITTANSIPNSAIQAGAVTPEKLSTNAITLGYAQITSNSTTTSGTFAVGSNTLGVSVTIPSGARRVRVTVYSVLLAASSTNTPAGAIFSGATVGALTNQLQQWNGGSSTSNQGMNMQWVSNVAPSAGTVAYTFAMLIGGGHTATLTAGAGFPAYILVEAI